MLFLMLFLTQILRDYLGVPEIPGNLMRSNIYML